MEIVNNRPEFSHHGINASKCFLKAHSSTVANLIKSPSEVHRESVLKLFTAIVHLEPHLSKQILSNFDFLSDGKSVEQLLSHSTSNDQSEKNTDSVRKAFIYFILAFMVEGKCVL